MKRIKAFVVGASLGIMAICIFGQEKPKFSPTEVQGLRLKVAQQAAQLAQRELQFACSEPQQKFQKAIGDLNAEADKVKTENGWPKETTFNPDTLVFSMPPPPPAPAKPTEKPAPPEVKK